MRSERLFTFIHWLYGTFSNLFQVCAVKCESVSWVRQWFLKERIPYLNSKFPQKEHYTVAHIFVKMPFHLCAVVFSLRLTGTIAVLSVWAESMQKQLSWVVHVLIVRALGRCGHRSRTAFQRSVRKQPQTLHVLVLLPLGLRPYRRALRAKCSRLNDWFLGSERA